MGVKCLLPLILIVFISGCAEDKTQAIVSDIERPLDDIDSSSLDVIVIEDETAEDITEETSDGGATEEESIEEQPNLDVEETPSEKNIIIIKDLKLEPQELTIKKGEKVTWKHQDEWSTNTKHLLNSHSNEFRSPVMLYGDEFTCKFENNGTFTYIDIMQKGRIYLRGTITVIE
ncbi:MAG: hypothetical protein U9O94_03385 [Nanoarchaeota archaeon]|nr:hypothetical protein [Nanoarchaeota archaeon]